MSRWTRALYQPNRPFEEGHRVTACPEHIALSGQAAAEGMVLLKNEAGALPLAKGTRIAAFGKGLYDVVKGGGGSGDVYTPFVTTLAEGMAQHGVLDAALAEYYEKNVRAQYAQGAAPGMTREPEVPAQLLEAAARQTDTAVIAISRFSGEGWERQGGDWDDPEFNPWGHEVSMPLLAAELYPDGDYYLTAAEKALVQAVTAAFAKVIVVLNVGGVMDASWINEDASIQAALLMGQAGMDGGSAAARILFGEVNPSGRLTDTWARTLEDYPSTEHFHDSPWYVEYTEDIYVGYRYFETLPGAKEKVVYPFGHGLSYTTFGEQMLGVSEVYDNDANRSINIDEKAQKAEEDFAACKEDSAEKDLKQGKAPTSLIFTIKVTNTGTRAGRHVTALYYQAPQGMLGRPARELGAFAKTRLLEPGAHQLVTLEVPLRQMAAFDDLGRVQVSAFVLEAGTYRFHLGVNVRTAKEVSYTWTLEKDSVVEQATDRLKPNALPQRLTADGSYEALPTGQVPDINACIFEKMSPGSEEALFPERRGRGRYLLMQPYAEGVHPLSEVADGTCSMEDFLAQLSVDDLIQLTGGTPNTGVANTCGVGGLEEYGVPALMTADGPAGVRINPDCGIPTTAWPTASLLASTWDTELIAAVGRAAGKELRENNLYIWLAPAMNLHRNPMCGRNFEYFSEDPLLTGKLAAAEVRGIQSVGAAACIKHFACNNKETNRKHSDSRVSLRALRELYLRGFEIAVKEGKPLTLMSAYNAINGQRASESYDLLTGILREEWGFDGMVTSDWWTRAEHYKEVLAGNDVKMATGFSERVRKAYEMGAVTREDLEICARRVLEFICSMD